MVGYINEHRGRFGVEPICKVLPIAPSTYYTHRSLQQDPERRSARAKRDDDLKLEIQRARGTTTLAYMAYAKCGAN